MTTRDLQDHIAFQRYCVSTLKSSENPTHGLTAVNVRNPFNGEPMSNGQFFDLHARLLAVLVEREEMNAALTSGGTR